jgi:hypothetical protein
MNTAPKNTASEEMHWMKRLGSEDEVNAWKDILSFVRPTTTEDKEQEDMDDSSTSACCYYSNLVEIVEELHESAKKKDFDAVSEKLDGVVFPHKEGALADVKAALEEARTAQASAELIQGSLSSRTDQSSSRTAQIGRQGKPRDDDEIIEETKIQEMMNAKELRVAEFDAELARSMLSDRMALQSENASKDVENAIVQLEKAAVRVESATSKAESLLCEMQSLSQAENSIGTQAARDNSMKVKRQVMKAGVQHKHDKGVPSGNIPSKCQALYDHAELVGDDSPFSVKSLETFWTKLDDQWKLRIRAISKTYNEYIRTSIIMNPSSTNEDSEDEASASADVSEAKSDEASKSSDGANIQRKRSRKESKEESKMDGTPSPGNKRRRRSNSNVTREARKDSTRTQQGPQDSTSSTAAKASLQILKNLFAKTRSETDRCGGGETEDNPSEKHHYFPGPRGKEVTGAQPFFACLVEAIASVAEDLHRSQYSAGNVLQQSDRNLGCPKSPPKSRLRKEAAVMGLGGGFRYGDFVFQKRDKHFWVFKPDSLPIIIEIKTFYRSDKNWESLVMNAVQQVFNHTSRYLTVGLNFGGAGIESHATGVIGSLAYVQVYRLELKDVGTERVHVKCIKSSMLPLMSQDVFSKWVKANPRSNEENRAEGALEKLYPNGSPDREDVPLGHLVLLQLMTLSKSELFGQTCNDDSNLQLVGSGSFGNVFRTNDGKVVKLSRHGRKAYLRAEGYAYKAIGHYGLKTEAECPNLAVAEEIKVSIKVGAITREMDALTMRPAGRPLQHFGDLTQDEAFLCDIVFDVALALQHMHKCKIAHNDVSLSNVIVVECQEGAKKSRKAMLVDLSLASPFDFKIPFFVGNPEYAHSIIQRDVEWYPRSFHDMAALGFLVAVLASGSTVPWSGFSTPNKTKADLKERHKKAKEAIHKLKDKKHVPQFEEWVELDNITSDLRKACNCRKLCSGRCNCLKMNLRCLDGCKCSPACKQRNSDLPEVPYTINYERSA